MLAKTPKPPYYAVISSAHVVVDDYELYLSFWKKAIAIAMSFPGFLGFESAKEELTVTVSYWTSLESIKAWKQQVDEIVNRNGELDSWYKSYTLRICTVEKAYHFEN